MRYDPLVSPIASEWLAIDEAERIRAVETYHNKAKIKLPNLNVHATFHTIIENQIAMREKSVVLALDRLLGEGLDRHDAIHAMGSVLSAQMYKLMKGENLIFDKETYAREMDRLTVESWHESFQEDENR